MVFHSVAEAVVLIVPTIYAMTGGLLLQWLLGYNFSVARLGRLHSAFRNRCRDRRGYGRISP
jgi:hypothetical protein